jgi:hypothetical protein
VTVQLPAGTTTLVSCTVFMLGTDAEPTRQLPPGTAGIRETSTGEVSSTLKAGLLDAFGLVKVIVTCPAAPTPI